MSDLPPRFLTLSQRALTRFRFTSMIHAHVLAGMSVQEAVRLVADTPIDGRTYSVRTLYRWLKAAQKGPLALEPAPRPTVDGSRVLGDDLLDFLVTQKDHDPAASVPELIERARQSNHLHPDALVDRGTAWRALKRRGVDTRRKASVGKDARRFAYSERMQLVIADFKHFRAGPTRRKRLALYVLDDASRYGLHVSVLSGGERAEVVLKALHAVLRRYGRFSLLYVDRGPGFIADVLTQIMARLDPPIPVILGTAGYPEGRGKIERFNRSVNARLLRHLAKDGVDPDLGALTLRLQHDLERYNHLPHRSLDGQSPHERWHQSERPLQSVGDDDALRELFTLPLERTVSADHVVSVDGVQYEVPRGHARTEVVLHRRMLEVQHDKDALYLEHRGVMVRLHPVDVTANAHATRSRTSALAPEPEGSPAVLSAAERAFARTLAPMTGADGGYADPDVTNSQEVP